MWILATHVTKTEAETTNRQWSKRGSVSRWTTFAFSKFSPNQRRASFVLKKQPSTAVVHEPREKNGWLWTVKPYIFRFYFDRVSHFWPKCHSRSRRNCRKAYMADATAMCSTSTWYRYLPANMLCVRRSRRRFGRFCRCHSSLMSVARAILKQKVM